LPAGQGNRAARKRGTTRSALWPVSTDGAASASVVAAGAPSSLRASLGHHAARAGRAATAGGRDAEARLKIGERARALRHCAADLAVGDAVAKTDVHGGGGTQLRIVRIMRLRRRMRQGCTKRGIDAGQGQAKFPASGANKLSPTMRQEWVPAAKMRQRRPPARSGDTVVGRATPFARSSYSMTSAY